MTGAERLHYSPLSLTVIFQKIISVYFNLGLIFVALAVVFIGYHNTVFGKVIAYDLGIRQHF